MVKLYGASRSRALRCLWLLEELRIPYEHEPLRWDTGETREAAFLAINPNGHVPVLVDGETVVWESLAINHHLVAKHGGPLAPDGPGETGLAFRWSFWAMAELEGPIDAVARHGAQLAEDWAVGPLGVLDAALADRDWLLGGRFSVADLNVAVMFLRPLLAVVDRTPWPRLERWLAACRARPALERVAELP